MSAQHVQASECFVHDCARLMEAVHLFPKKWALRRLVHVRARKIRRCTSYLGPARPCTDATYSGILLMLGAKSIPADRLNLALTMCRPNRGDLTQALEALGLSRRIGGLVCGFRNWPLDGFFTVSSCHETACKF